MRAAAAGSLIVQQCCLNAVVQVTTIEFRRINAEHALGEFLAGPVHKQQGRRNEYPVAAGQLAGRDCLAIKIGDRCARVQFQLADNDFIAVAAAKQHGLQKILFQQFTVTACNGGHGKQNRQLL